MTFNRAFIAAATQVRIERLGGQWLLSVYDNDRKAWRNNSHSVSYATAVAMRRVALIRRALEFLGIKDANVEAYWLAERQGGWREVVRAFVRQGRL